MQLEYVNRLMLPDLMTNQSWISYWGDICFVHLTILFYLFMRVPYHSSKFIIHTTPISFGDDDFSSRLNCTLATRGLEATLILA
ncbi:hypothetical protein P8452_24262 [Trifolium repens]|nr:hypothetical protein P8452_24262 [Trifolium repens]